MRVALLTAIAAAALLTVNLCSAASATCVHDLTLTATLHGGPLDGKDVPILARPTEEGADDWPLNIVLNFGDSLLDYRRQRRLLDLSN